MKPIEEDPFLKDAGPQTFSYGAALEAPPSDEVSKDWGLDLSEQSQPEPPAAQAGSPESPPLPASAAPSFLDDAGDGPGDFKTSGEPPSAPPMVSAPDNKDDYIATLRHLASAPDDIGGPSEASQMAIAQAKERDRQGNLNDIIHRALFAATTRSGASPYGPESHFEEQSALAQQQRADALKQRGAEKRSAAQLALAKALAPKEGNAALDAYRLAEAEGIRGRNQRDQAELDRKASEGKAAGEARAVEEQRREKAMQETERHNKAMEEAGAKKAASGAANAAKKAAAKVAENEAANTITFDGMTLHGGAGVDKEERHKAKEKLSNAGAALSGMDTIAKDIEEYVKNPGLSTKNVLGTDVALVAGSISQGAGSGVLNGHEFERYASALGANPGDAAAIVSLFEGAMGDPGAAKQMLSRVRAARKIMRDGAISYAGGYGFSGDGGVVKQETAKTTHGGEQKSPGGKLYVSKKYSKKTGKTYFIDSSGNPIEEADGQL